MLTVQNPTKVRRGRGGGVTGAIQFRTYIEIKSFCQLIAFCGVTAIIAESLSSHTSKVKVVTHMSD